MPARSTSLIELKKQQWARERAEEMTQCGGFWGRFGDGGESRHRPCIRSQYNSTSDLKTYDSTSSCAYKRRTPSLPPIGSTTYNCLSPPEEDRSGRGGDTSGYASDSAGNESSENWKPPWNSAFPRRASEASSNGSYNREERERVKWGERGLGVGHLWSPNLEIPSKLLPQIDQSGPAWLQRGLQEPAQVLVITHDESLPASLANSHDMSLSRDTLLTCSEDSQRNFIRGQKCPVDPHVVAEKERKRQKALEHQKAIQQQLEEKEVKKKKEQEKLELEERAEEERLRKYRELESRRIEEEKRKQREKEEKEERVARALKEAIEIAEKKAKEDKAKTRRRRAVNSPNAQPPPQLSDTTSIALPSSNIKSQEFNVPDIQQVATTTPKRQEKIDVSEKPVPEPSEIPEPPSPTPPPSKTPPLPSSPPQSEEDDKEPPYFHNLAESNNPPPSPSVLTLAVHEITFETGELEVSRLAVVPPTDEGRILTPTKFRQTLFSTIERSTQTETSFTRSSRRTIRLEDRPKWGVNRPPTRYVKASDRDPYRRTRSLQRTSRDADDSRSPSPVHTVKPFRGTSCSPFNSDSSSKSTKGVGTPRIIQVLPHAGVLKKSSSGRKYLSIKNAPRSGSTRQHHQQRKFDVEELLSVKDVLSQLTALKQGLKMKQKEWEVTRSPTPFSEVSSKGQ